MSTQRKQSAGSAASKAKKIASEGENVRERTRKAFAETVSDQRFDIDSIADLAGGIIDGAAEAVKSAAPKERENVLKEVIDGLADGFSGSANAARLALQEAKGRSESFVKEDVRRVTDNLRVLDDVFFETVSHAVDRVQDQVGAQVSDLQAHARRAATRMRPALENALHAAMDHPGELLTETASTGAKAAPRAAGALLQAMSGLLAGAGDVLLGDEDDATQKTPTKKKPTKKTSAKKSAAKKKTAKKAKKKTAKKKSAKKKS